MSIGCRVRVDHSRLRAAFSDSRSAVLQFLAAVRWNSNRAQLEPRHPFPLPERPFISHHNDVDQRHDDPSPPTPIANVIIGAIWHVEQDGVQW